jgi:hypothetical protein
MENELLFEHLINDKLSNYCRWSDLYRSASVLSNDNFNIKKVAQVEILLLLALSKLQEERNDLKIIGECIKKLNDNPTFETIETIISELHSNNILF